MKKLIGIAVAMSALAVCANTPPSITNVRASQREGTKLVDIYYDATDADNDLLKVRIEISDNDGAKYSVPAFSLTGDIGEGIAPGTGKHIVWDAGTDWDGEYSDQMRVKVFAIDAQGFPGMEWGNEVPPGGFLMGQDGGAEGSGPSRHVNIPWSYWLGKYEITVGQYCDFLNTALAAGYVRRSGQTAVYTVMGEKLIENMHGSYKLVDIGDNYDIRWNVNNFEVVGTYTNYPVRVTWYGAIAFAHFYGYDLPTEAEWEKAARGPDHDDQDEHQVYAWGNTLTTSYGNYGQSGTRKTKPVGYYNGNQTPIGPDTVNGYGLYDMTGNVAEWTLTSGSYGIAIYPQQEAVMSPCHQYWYASTLCYKGGSWADIKPAIYVRSSAEQTSYWSFCGFRVVRRHEVSRPQALREIFEDFETWPEKTDYGEKTVTVAAGTWKLDRYSYLLNNKENAYSGTKYATVYDRLYLPALASQLVEVRMKVRNTSNNSREVHLSSGNATDGYTSRSYSVAAYSDYQTISLTPTRDAESYYIYASSDVYIDDIEIWTIPRTAGE